MGLERSPVKIPDRPTEKEMLVAGRFVLDRVLGRGAFGTVWKAHDREAPHAPVALKIMLERLRFRADVLQRFQQEISLLADFQHPNVARLLAWDAEGSQPFFAMELVPGETMYTLLRRRARDGAPLQLSEILWVCDRLCSTLAYAHSRGVVHRDLKPKNVIVYEEGDASFLKVLDFGVAKILHGGESETTTKGRVLGSVLYMSPEQISGSEVDARTDIFALGSIVFEMLSGRRAWARDARDRPLVFNCSLGTHPDANNHISILRRISRDPLPRAGVCRAGLPPDVDDVLQKATQKNPADRFQSASAFRTALQGALRGAKETSSPESTPTKTLVPAFETDTDGAGPTLIQPLPGSSRRT